MLRQEGMFGAHDEPQTMAALDDFIQWAGQIGVVVGSDEAEALCEGCRWLATGASASGLSQYATAESALIRGMGPALSYFMFEAAPRKGSLVDLGAGNGAIGATIALLSPDLQVCLADRAKRAYTASEMLIARMGVQNARAEHRNAESLPAVHDAVVFRALARADVALSLAGGVIRDGGVICAYHRVGDTDFQRPGTGPEVVGTHATMVDGLAVTCYRK